MGNNEFTPLDISGCVAWWDSADGSTISLSGSDVTAWASKAAGALTPAQADAAKRPSVATPVSRQMISFDGVDEHLTLADAGATALKFGSGEFSIYAVYRTDDVNRGMLIGKGAFAQAGYIIRINNADTNNGEMLAQVRDTSSNQALISAGATSGTNYNDDAIRLVTVTRDASNLRQYQNGVEVTESPASAAAVGSLNDTNAFFMGAFQGTAQFYNGELGDVVVYNRVLDAGERQQLTDYLKGRWGIA